MNFRSIVKLFYGCVLGLFFLGCTSLGHSGRETPKIDKQATKFSEIGFDGDDNELSSSIENFLERKGIKVRILSAPQVKHQFEDKEYKYAEVQTRYVIRVRSKDLDTCMPNWSRQMHFNLSVIDYQERNRVFLMNGEYGCESSIIENLDTWLSKLK